MAASRSSPHAANECPLWVSTPDGSDPAEKYTKEQRRALAKDWRCLSLDGNGIYVEGGLLIADAPLLKVLGIDDPGAAKALADGKLLSFHKPQVDRNGTVGIKLITDLKAADRAAEQNKPVPGELKSFPAYQVVSSPDSYGLQSVLSPAAAKAAGLTTVPLGAYFSTDRMPSTEERQKLDAEIAKLGSDVELTVEQGWVDENGLVLLALTVFMRPGHHRCGKHRHRSRPGRRGGRSQDARSGRRPAPGAPHAQRLPVRCGRRDGCGPRLGCRCPARGRAAAHRGARAGALLPGGSRQWLGRRR